jgi:hypothetical protein
MAFLIIVLLQLIMKPGMQTLTLWFGGLMALLAFMGAFAFAFTNLMDDRLFGSRRTWFIAILVAYGIYRSFRLYQVFKQMRHEE